MTTLYTGFKGTSNSSYILVSRIPGAKLFLTNSFIGLRLDIEKLRESYDRVYMFGLDKSLRDSIRIEECAEKDGSVLYTALNSDEIAGRLAVGGINCLTSNKPTHYLCNDAYYYILERYNRKAILIHVPPARYMTDRFVSSVIKALGE